MVKGSLPKGQNLRMPFDDTLAAWWCPDDRLKNAPIAKPARESIRVVQQVLARLQVMKMHEGLKGPYKQNVVVNWAKEFKVWLDDRTWHYIWAPIIPFNIPGKVPFRQLKPQERKELVLK